MKKIFLDVTFATLCAALLAACGGDSGSSADSSGSDEGSSVSVPGGSSDASTNNVVTGTLTDTRDGQTYRTVKIGDQVWMAENLNYAYTGIPYEYKGYTSDSTSWCYDNDPANCAKYGRLYAWAAAMDSVGEWSTNGKGCGYGKECSVTSPVRGICPEGWHLPSRAEWDALIVAVDGSITEYEKDNVAGSKLRSQTGWTVSGVTNEDSFGFSALPAGYRDYYGAYRFEGHSAIFWGSTEYGSTGAYYVDLGYRDDAYLSNLGKYRGFSVRCLKDYSTERKSNGETDNDGKSSASEGNSSDSEEPDSSGSEGVEGSSASVLGGSSDASTYDVVTGMLTDSRDGQTYRTVKIGDQVWMAENLNYAYTGVPFDNGRYTSDSTSWCYDNKPANCAKYGRLYTWAAAMDSVGEWSTSGKGCGDGETCSVASEGSATLVRGICPKGWHLPSHDEWKALIVAVDGSITEYMSSNTAGTKLKSTTVWAWNDYDDISGNGTDAFGFSALPAGYRYNDGGYGNDGYSAYFWSSTEYDSNGAYNMYLSYDRDGASLNGSLKYYGFSVRCLKD